MFAAEPGRRPRKEQPRERSLSEAASAAPMEVVRVGGRVHVQLGRKLSSEEVEEQYRRGVAAAADDDRRRHDLLEEERQLELQRRRRRKFMARGVTTRYDDRATRCVDRRSSRSAGRFAQAPEKKAPPPGAERGVFRVPCGVPGELVESDSRDARSYWSVGSFRPPHRARAVSRKTQRTCVAWARRRMHELVEPRLRAGPLGR